VPTADDDTGDAGSGIETGVDPGLDYLEAESCSITGANPRAGWLGLVLLGLLGLPGINRRRR
jgi:MYXO-CTERM domain-containing protein